MNILSIERIQGFLDKVLYRTKRERVAQDAAIKTNKVSHFATGTIVTGTLNCSDNCYFNGILHGDLEVEKKLVLGYNSDVTGKIDVGDLLARGKINGPIRVYHEAVYTSTSTVTAPCLETRLLIVEPGAVLNLGGITMQGLEPAALLPKAVKHVSKPTKTTHEEMTVNTKPERVNKQDDMHLFQFFENKDTKQ